MHHDTTTAPGSRALRLGLLAGILLLATLVRGLYLHDLAADPAFTHPQVDPGYHDAWARALVRGVWTHTTLNDVSEIPTAPYFRPPGYPYFLAGVYRLTHGSYLAARIAQLLLGLLNVLLVCRLTRRLADPAAGLLAALLTGLSWPLIYFEGELLEPVLLITLLLLTLNSLLAGVSRRAPHDGIILDSWRSGRDPASPESSAVAGKARPSRSASDRKWPFSGLGRATLCRGRVPFRRMIQSWRALLPFFAAGLTTGLFALTRPNILLLVPLFALWAILAGPTPRGRHALRVLLGLGLGLAVTILPATVRNYRVAREWVLISANGGINLYIGNNPQADGLFAAQVGDLGKFRTSDAYADIRRALEARLGRPLTHGEVSRHFSRLAWDYVRAEPLAALRLTARKALLLVGPREPGHNRSIHYDRQFSPVLRRLPLGFTAAAALGLAGFLLVAVRRRALRGSLQLDGVLLLGLVTGVYAASFLPFFISGQYRAPLIPLLAVAGGLFLRELGRLARTPPRWPAALWAAGALALFGLLAVNWTGYEPNLAKWYVDQGNALRDEGRYAESAAALREAVALRPDHAESHINLAATLEKLGDFAGAEAATRRSLELAEPSAGAWLGLGNALLQQRRLPEAAAAYQEALALDPDRVEALKNLAILVMSAGRSDDAIPILEHVLALDPASPHMLVLLGHARAARGERAAARAAFQRALQLNPDSQPARRGLAALEGDPP